MSQTEGGLKVPQWTRGMALLLTLLLLATVVHHLLKRRPQGSMLPCKSNVKNIATALEMYAADHGGRYPNTLQSLPQGNYLKLIPTCPAAALDTYSQTYHSTAAVRNAQGNVVSGHDTFQFYCKGQYHRDPPNHPRYDSGTGLIMR